VSRSARGCHIINLASLSALGPAPGLSVYAATKHGVLGFTTSLQGDLLEAGAGLKMLAVFRRMGERRRNKAAA
jgi:short-subunit dehydrogenase